MKIKIIFLAVSLVAVLSISVAAVSESYTIAVPMVDGLDATNMTAYLEKMASILTNKLGAEVKTRPLVYKYGDSVMDMVMADFKAGKSDIGYVYGREYAAYRNSGGKDITPLFTLSMFKSRLMKQCFYTRIGEIEKISELRGKKWAASTYLPARYLLYTADIDEPLESFFNTMAFISDAPLKNIIEKMQSRELDVFSTYEIIMKVSGELDRKDPVVAPLYCRDYDHTWIFVARNGIAAERLEQIREIILNAHNDPDFAAFKFAFQLIQGRFVDIRDEPLAEIGKICDLVKEKGWEKEEKVFYKKYRVEAGGPAPK